MAYKRTHSCGELTLEQVGLEVTLAGWVHSVRDHGNLVFVDLRDRSGIVQTVFDQSSNPSLHQQARELRSEYVIILRGIVNARPPGTENPNLPTGSIEIKATDLQILNKSEPLPFPIEDNINVTEETRLRYRYLDLRRPIMQRNLLLRHKVCKLVRNYLDKHGFIEIETPFLTKSTPEGARDFLVPSRLSVGHFYALPQSPQLFKQILMVAGFEKYFQIARCLRDEDLRADRQPEHTQIDIEMSFIDQADLFNVIEPLIAEIFEFVLGSKVTIPFPKMSYKEAILRYGTDKPDLRFGLEIVDVSEEMKSINLSFLSSVLNKPGGVVRAINVKGCANFSRSQLDKLEETVKTFGAKGLLWIKLTENGIESPISKYLSTNALMMLREKLEAKEGDLLLFIADKEEIVANSLGRLRLLLGDQLQLRDKTQYKFLWVIDFPLFQWNDEEKKWDAVHHPFTSPVDEDLPLLLSQPEKVRAKAYDLVVNGIEIGGGSIRIHKAEIQSQVFSILGISEEEAKEKFGFLLEAFRYGAPPHGGIALGLDRILMILTGSNTIRDVIAFPKTQKGICLLTGAPSSVSKKQLEELHIKIIE